MGPDEKIRKHAGPRATAFAISGVRAAGEKQRVAWNLAHVETGRANFRFERFPAGGIGSKLGVDHRVDQ